MITYQFSKVKIRLEDGTYGTHRGVKHKYVILLESLKGTDHFGCIGVVGV
jgi:hypothetical protein